MNYLKIIFLKCYLLYEKIIPVERGKFFLSRLLTSVIGEVNIKSTSGIWLRIIPSSPMDRSYLSNHNESHEIIMQEICMLNPGDIFVDIGANIGFYSFCAAQKIGGSGRVYSFEPSKREYRRLLNGLELNKLNNILPFNCALSDHDGVVKFQINKYHTGLNQFDRDNIHEDNNYIVPVYRGDNLIQQQKIALVKIDVEGAEIKVLEGLRGLLVTKIIERLIVEITPDFLGKYNSSKSDLYAMMEAFGYTSLKNSNEWQYDEIFVLDELI